MNALDFLVLAGAFGHRIKFQTAMIVISTFAVQIEYVNRLMTKPLILIGAIIGLLSVGMGAMGTHALEPRLAEWYDAESVPKKLDSWNIAVRYMFFHGLSLLVLANLSISRPGKLLKWSGCFFVGGIVLFSGCLFAWVLLDQRFLVRVVPLGGLSFMFGWICLIGYAIKFRGERSDG